MTTATATKTTLTEGATYEVFDRLGSAFLTYLGRDDEGRFRFEGAVTGRPVTMNRSAIQAVRAA